MKRLFGLQQWCLGRSESLFKVAVGFMSLLAVTRMAYQFWRLLIDRNPNGAIDLRNIHKWVDLWFAGEPLKEIIFLPATYAMLWPFAGWLPFEAARWLWAVLYIASLIWLAYIVIGEAGIGKGREILFAALFILAIYPTSITIGNGQVILFLLPAVLTAVLMERGRGGGIVKDIFVSALFLFSLIKIPVTAPFLLIPLITQRAFRPLFIAACGYIALTYFAMSFRDAGLIETLRIWIEDSSALAAGGGYADIHIWLGSLGLNQLILPASLVLIAAFALWLYAFRNIDVWVQLGVAAIVARIWTYHRLYDDLLMIVPIITVFRIVRSNRLSPNESLAADFLLLVSWLGLLSPGFFLQLPPPIGTLFRTGQAVIWISMLAFLVYDSYRAGKTRYA